MVLNAITRSLVHLLPDTKYLMPLMVTRLFTNIVHMSIYLIRDAPDLASYTQ